jgi:hypothetical protein
LRSFWEGATDPTFGLSRSEKVKEFLFCLITHHERRVSEDGSGAPLLSVNDNSIDSTADQEWYLFYSYSPYVIPTKSGCSKAITNDQTFPPDTEPKPNRRDKANGYGNPGRHLQSKVPRLGI